MASQLVASVQPRSVVSWELPASAVLFGLSSVVRSNGVLHSGFFLYSALHEAWAASILLTGNASATVTAQQGLQQPQQSQRQQKWRMRWGELLSRLLRVLLLLCCTALCFLPFITFQTFGYLSFCPATVTSHPRATLPSLQAHQAGAASHQLGHGSSTTTPGAHERTQGQRSTPSVAAAGYHNASLACLATSWLSPLRPLTSSLPATVLPPLPSAETPPWCTTRVPYIYGFVQKEYW